MPGRRVRSVSIATGLSNTRDKLRSSNMLGFVCFIPLLGGLAVPPSVVGQPAETPLRSATAYMVTPTSSKLATTALARDRMSKGVAEERRPQQPRGTIDHLQAAAIASLKSDAASASAVVAPLVNKACVSLKSEAAQARATQRQEFARNASTYDAPRR
jgi:hypothetical protein